MDQSHTPHAALILAAGDGSRMLSEIPKSLHRIAGATMLDHVITTARAAGCGRIVVVVADAHGAVAEIATRRSDSTCPVEIIVQAKPRGTADAVDCARDILADFTGTLSILFADSPLLTAATLAQMVARREQNNAALCLLGFTHKDPHRFGSIILDGQNHPQRIREAAEISALDPDPQAPCNGGAVSVAAPLLWSLLKTVIANSTSHEYYLTDIVAVATKQGHACGLVMADMMEAFGVDDRAALARAETIMQARLRQQAQRQGVTLRAPETIFLACDTVFGRDVEIAPHVVIEAGVRLGDGVHIASFSHLEDATIGAHSRIGPHSRLRNGVRTGDQCRIGNFVEIKASILADRVKIPHLAYIGDADISAGVNIGAGVITCNYDGSGKYPTRIGEGAFVGSDTVLIAPLTIGAGAYIGSGSIIRRDVAADTVVTARAEQKTRRESATALRKRLAARNPSGDMS